MSTRLLSITSYKEFLVPASLSSWFQGADVRYEKSRTRIIPARILEYKVSCLICCFVWTHPTSGREREKKRKEETRWNERKEEPLEQRIGSPYKWLLMDAPSSTGDGWSMGPSTPYNCSLTSYSSWTRISDSELRSTCGFRIPHETHFLASFLSDSELYVKFFVGN